MLEVELTPLTKDQCYKLLLNLAECGGSVTKVYTYHNGFPDELVRYHSMFVTLAFPDTQQSDKFRSLGWDLTEVDVIAGC